MTNAVPTFGASFHLRSNSCRAFSRYFSTTILTDGHHIIRISDGIYCKLTDRTKFTYKTEASTPSHSIKAWVWAKIYTRPMEHHWKIVTKLFTVLLDKSVTFKPKIYKKKFLGRGRPQTLIAIPHTLTSQRVMAPYMFSYIFIQNTHY